MIRPNRIRPNRLPLLALGLAITLTSFASAEPPKAKTTYLGRRIAQTMSYHGAGWLIRKDREKEERSSMMLRQLKVEKGMTLCDMGCGNGFHTLKLAELTGAEGQVLAVDVQPEMLLLLRQRAEKTDLENITPILGSFHNPRLPANQVDMILLVDVYHEFSYPVAMLAAMRRSLKPNGVIVLCEFRAEDPDVPIKPLHKMSKAQIMKEMTANKFKLVREYDGLPWQHLMFFGRDDAPAEQDGD